MLKKADWTKCCQEKMSILPQRWIPNIVKKHDTLNIMLAVH